MKYRITHRTSYAYSEPVPLCQNKVRLAPRQTTRQSCESYRLSVAPDPRDIDRHFDYFGNQVEYFSLVDAHRSLEVTSCCVVDVVSDAPPTEESSPPWEAVAADLTAMPPKAPVACCLLSHASELAGCDPRFAEYARISFTPGRPIAEAARHLTTRIYKEFQYNAESTEVTTPVSEVFEQRAGVCQDFAHLQIACLRSLGLAARYVSGYLRTIPPPGEERLVGADASHAWVSVYCGETGWIDFDPTNNLVPSHDHVTVAYGRDYADVCPIQGVVVGGGNHAMSVSVDVAPLEEVPPGD